MKAITNNLNVVDRALNQMNTLIKKSLLNTSKNNRDDLEQEIKLKVIEAVVNNKLQSPPTYSDFFTEFNKKNHIAS